MKLFGLLLYSTRLLWVGVVFTIASIIMIFVFGIRSYDVRNNRYFTSFVNFFLIKPLGIQVTVDDSAAVYDDQPVVCVLNHQGLLDIMTAGFVLPVRSAALAKKSLGQIPIWGKMFQWGGNVLVDRKSPEARKQAMVDLRATLLEKRASLVVFPEGTRGRGAELLKFHAGAFLTAQQNKTLVQPVVFSSYRDFVSLKKLRSYISIKVLPPVDLSNIDQSELRTEVDKIRDTMQVEKDRLNEEIAASI